MSKFQQSCHDDGRRRRRRPLRAPRLRRPRSRWPAIRYATAVTVLSTSESQSRCTSSSTVAPSESPWPPGPGPGRPPAGHRAGTGLRLARVAASPSHDNLKPENRRGAAQLARPATSNLKDSPAETRLPLRCRVLRVEYQ